MGGVLNEEMLISLETRRHCQEPMESSMIQNGSPEEKRVKPSNNQRTEGEWDAIKPSHLNEKRTSPACRRLHSWAVKRGWSWGEASGVCSFGGDLAIYGPRGSTPLHWAYVWTSVSHRYFHHESSEGDARNATGIKAYSHVFPIRLCIV